MVFTVAALSGLNAVILPPLNVNPLQKELLEHFKG